MQTLAVLVHAHPTLHIALQARMYNLTLVHLSGSSPSPSNPVLVQSAADLHAVVHLTGGKVRAAVVWRKSLDATLGSLHESLRELTQTSASSSGVFGMWIVQGAR